MNMQTYHDPTHDRPWQVCGTADILELERAVLPRRFILALAVDSEALAHNDLRAMCRHLLQAGARYVCCWGPDCHRVHDAFDASTGELNRADAVVMTTQHADEPWREVLWFATHAAFPDDVYEDAFGAVVVLAIGNDAWYREACDYLADGAPLTDEA